MTSVHVLLSLAGLSATASAATPTINHALALRGGALVVPLEAVDPDADSPVARLVKNGRTVSRLDSNLVWIRSEPRAVRLWSLPPYQSRVSATPSRRATPYLVLRLPDDGRGHLMIDGTRILLHWADLPAAMPSLRRLTPSARDHPVDPYASSPLQEPLESWRCELLAEMRGLAPPPLHRFEDTTSWLIALAAAGPWRLAMHQLAAADLGVARRIAELLTGTARDSGHNIAAWLSSGPPLDELLAIAISQAGEDDTVAARALRWCERQTSLLAWITADRGESVLLSMANPEQYAVLAEIAWAQPGELPLASRVPAGRSTTTRIDPLPRQELAPLLLEVGQNHMTLSIDRSVLRVEPPGLMLGPLHPNLTLSDVRGAAKPPPAPVNRQTFAQFRRLMGHWEVMLECRWPAPMDEAGAHHRESVIIDLRVGDRVHVIEVTPLGLISSHQSETPAVHVSRLDHAWLCRVVLPDAWIAERMSMALMRTHAHSPAFETWPTPCVPWRVAFDPTPMEITAWDQDGTPMAP
jgi:hypothetical protein